MVQTRALTGDGCACGITLMNDPQCVHMLGTAGASDLQIGHCIRRDSLPQLFGEGKRESYRLVPGVTDEGATQIVITTFAIPTLPGANRCSFLRQLSSRYISSSRLPKFCRRRCLCR